ncbi:hypothetical protein [Microbacterium sp. K36]|uniref:hypothetical protein n=1 Tax=Microbacterium sp. K36 TaxID=2305439 RepID=UPI00109D3409|nr:hypothetical protein [Microbacterium sp. K36]
MSFPDIEAMVRQFLLPIAAPHKVVVIVPADRPGTFVRLFRNGGAASNRIVDRPQVTVEAWAPDSATASDLLNRCRTALLNDLARLPLVRGVDEINGPYWTPDPDSETPRYRLTVQITVRARRA